MYRDDSIDEVFVSHIWNSGYFKKDALRAKDGRKIEIICHGQRNNDSGADFHGAEIRISGQIQRGDVEIHVKNSHWRVHHHDVNPRYNNTILHVAMWDDSIGLLAKKQNGEHIPTLVLYDYLDNPIGKLRKVVQENKADSDQCRVRAEPISLADIGTALDGAGIGRFIHRVKKLEQQLEVNRIDQLLYERIMEALGYSKNRDPFCELAQKAPLEILLGRSPQEIQAILLGIADLLPSQNAETEFDEETKLYVSNLEKLWKPILPQYKNRLMINEQWEFLGIRPGNFPTRRIAGISYVLSMCKNGMSSEPLLAMFLSAFDEGDIIKNLRNKFTSYTFGYWAQRYTFGGKRHKKESLLIGKNRISDIIINVILPIILAYAYLTNSKKLQQSAIKSYASHGKLQNNKITEYVADQIFYGRKDLNSVVNSAMRQQGLIHLYQNFCIVQNCQDCPLA